MTAQSFMTAQSYVSAESGRGLTEAQGAALGEAGLDVVYVPVEGDGIVHALTNVAAAEVTAVGGTRPATPAELRTHLAEVLAADLEREPTARRFWPMLDDPEATDDHRRAMIDALTDAAATAETDYFTLAAAAAVLGLRVTVIPPDGAPVVFGPESGRRVVLVHLPGPGTYTGRWGATEPATSVPPPAPRESRPAPQRRPAANLDANPFTGSSAG